MKTKTVNDIILAIETSHGEITLAPSDLLTLAREIKKLDNMIDELNEAAFNAACDRDY